MRVILAVFPAFAPLGGVMPWALDARAPPLNEPALREVA